MQIDWLAFSPWQALAGGLLIGAAAWGLWQSLGRIAGISGMLGGLCSKAADWDWRLAFVVGLLAAPWLYQCFAPLPPMAVSQDWQLLILAGLLVGFGSRYGSGCTSGHGVCGLARGSVRSLVATLIFMAAAMATLYVSRQLGGH